MIQFSFSKLAFMEFCAKTADNFMHFALVIPQDFHSKIGQDLEHMAVVGSKRKYTDTEVT